MHVHACAWLIKRTSQLISRVLRSSPSAFPKPGTASAPPTQMDPAPNRRSAIGSSVPALDTAGGAAWGATKESFAGRVVAATARRLPRLMTEMPFFLSSSLLSRVPFKSFVLHSLTSRLFLILSPVAYTKINRSFFHSASTGQHHTRKADRSLRNVGARIICITWFVLLVCGNVACEQPTEQFYPKRPQTTKGRRWTRSLFFFTFRT